MNTATDQKGALFDDMLHTMACKSAIKAHYDTDILELQASAHRVMNDRTIRFCPHGKICHDLAFKIQDRTLLQQELSYG